MSTQKTKRNVPPNNLNNIPRLKRKTSLVYLRVSDMFNTLLKRKHGASTISWRVSRGLPLQALRNVPLYANMEIIT